MNCAFVITSFGDRQKLVRDLFQNIRDDDEEIDIVLYTDREHASYTNEKHHPIQIIVPSLWEGHRREHHRNGDYYPIQAIIELKEDYDVLCCLDDDMLIYHHDGFYAGFEMAYKFGIVLPANPRLYVRYDSNGEDVSKEVRRSFNEMGIPGALPAVNFSPMFVSTCSTMVRFADDYVKKFIKEPCRGPMALWRSLWEMGISPLIVPESWCVCGENAQHWKDYKVFHNKPAQLMCLHTGHPEVRKVFNLEKS